MTIDDEVNGAISLPKSVGLRSLRQNIVLTAATQIAVVSATFFQYGIIRRWHGLDALGSFSQLMRVRGILEFAVLVLMPMALSRELAMRSDDSEVRNRRTIIHAGMATGGLFLAVCIVFMLLFPNWSSVALFGNVSFAVWIMPFCLLLFGYALCLMVAAIARGLMTFHLVNMLQFAYVAAIPMALLLLGRSLRMTQIVSTMGGCAVLLAICFYFLTLKREKVISTQEVAMANPISCFEAGTTLLKYGAPRLSVIVCMGLQSQVLPWLVSQRGDVNTLVALNGLLGIVSASTLLVAPLGMVMLPHLSRLIAIGEKAEAGRQTSRMLTFSLLAGGIGSLGAMALLQPVITLWLGAEIASHTALMIASALVIPGFLVIEVLRNPLDSISKAPWNVLTYASGAATTALTFFIIHHWFECSVDSATAISLTCGLLVAASVSTLVGSYLFGIRILDQCLKICSLVWFVGVVILATGYYWMSPIQHVLTGLIIVFIYTAILILRAPSWLIELVPKRLQPMVEWSRK